VREQRALPPRAAYEAHERFSLISPLFFRAMIVTFERYFYHDDVAPAMQRRLGFDSFHMRRDASAVAAYFSM
jgi:hypothetical protein